MVGRGVIQLNDMQYLVTPLSIWWRQRNHVYIITLGSQIYDNIQGLSLLITRIAKGIMYGHIL